MILHNILWRMTLLGRMRAEWFCWLNLHSRMILLRIFCRLIMSSRIILQTDSVEQNHSALILPKKIATRKAETYIYGALYISLSFSCCYFWGRMRKEWFCSTEWFCRIFLAETFCCAEWVWRIFCRLLLSRRIILLTYSVEQNHSAEWFCSTEWFSL